jgi:DNA polymerase-3 subunit gamma/tau
MRDALSVMDQMVSYAGNDIRGEEIRGLLGLVETDLLAGLAIAILSGRSGEALDCVEQAFARGYSIEELMEAFTSFLRNLLMVTTGASLALQDVSDSEMELLGRAARNVPDIAVLDVLRIMAGAGYQARNSSLPRVVFESAVLTASKLCMAFDIADLPPVSGKVAVTSVTDEAHSDTTPADEIPGPADSVVRDAAKPPQDSDPHEGEREEQPERGEIGNSAGGNGSPVDPEVREAEKEVTRRILDMFDAISHETSEGQG